MNKFALFIYFIFCSLNTFGNACQKLNLAGTWVYQNEHMTITQNQCELNVTGTVHGPFVAHIKSDTHIAMDAHGRHHTGTLVANATVIDWNNGTRWTKETPQPQYTRLWENGGCQEHFSTLFKQLKGQTVQSCAAACQENNCVVFHVGREDDETGRHGWCNLYFGECTNNGDATWDAYRLDHKPVVLLEKPVPTATPTPTATPKSRISAPDKIIPIGERAEAKTKGLMFWGLVITCGVVGTAGGSVALMKGVKINQNMSSQHARPNTNTGNSPLSFNASLGAMKPTTCTDSAKSKQVSSAIVLRPSLGKLKRAKLS